jgi:hypothetical protein
LSDFTLKVHYKPRSDEELSRLSRKKLIYAVPNGSALSWDDGVISSIGPVYLFEMVKGEHLMLKLLPSIQTLIF